MGYVAVTAALFAAGAWLGRDLNGGVGIVAFIAAFAVLIGMQFAMRRSAQLAVGLLLPADLLHSGTVTGRADRTIGAWICARKSPASPRSRR
jgi:hypothetical protein